LVLKEHGIPYILNGNSRAWWGTPGKDLGDYAKKAIDALETMWHYKTNKHQKKITIHSLIGFFVRINYELRKDDNISCFYADKCDPPRLIFRSGTMVDLDKPNSVYRNLIKVANIKHVVNLYAGPFPLGDVYEKEKEIIEQVKGTYHDERKSVPSRKWRYLIQKEKDYNNKKDEAIDIVSMVIQDILLPKGKKPKPGENVLIHCGGGMHRTGMIIGIIRRIFSSNSSMPQIIDDYRKHVGWKNNVFIGGREELNERFIEEFPQEKLEDLTNIEQRIVPDGKFDERGY